MNNLFMIVMTLLPYASSAWANDGLGQDVDYTIAPASTFNDRALLSQLATGF
ncbi:MAG: hypothetical protein IVW54_23085 [Candidatus Binataceae bacterium]|nr:hypothetical protein [Candidatus Binataceae bacterium]